MPKNPFRQVSEALSPPKKKPLPAKASAKATAATTRAQPTARKAAMDAAERKRNQSKFTRSSTNKGKR